MHVLVSVLPSRAARAKRETQILYTGIQGLLRVAFSAGGQAIPSSDLATTLTRSNSDVVKEAEGCENQTHAVVRPAQEPFAMVDFSLLDELGESLSPNVFSLLLVSSVTHPSAARRRDQVEQSLSVLVAESW